jgi:uncharacterized membrane protein YhaH (DUF805 family)
MIPIFLKLHVRGKTGRGFNLWFPVVLIWIVLLFFMVVFLPLVVIAAIFTWRIGYGKSLLMFYPCFFYLLFQLSGLKLDIESKKEKIFLNFV